MAKPAAATIATTTKLTVSSKSLFVGQTLTVTVKVVPHGGSALPRGTIQLLNFNKKTGLTGTLNRAGRVTFSFDPGNALFSGTYSLSARYVNSGSFIGSKSRAAAVTILIPARTALSDGLQIATVTAGSGKAAKKGQKLVAEYTGFFASNGAVFDETSTHPTAFSYVLYKNPEGVIPGFDEGTNGMLVGETRVIVIPSALGYKDGQLRVFVVHLLAIA